MVCIQLFSTPWTVTRQAPPSMGFSKQEYWSGLPFPSPGDLPDPGIKLRSPALQVDSLLSEPPLPFIEWLTVSSYTPMKKIMEKKESQLCIKKRTVNNNKACSIKDLKSRVLNSTLLLSNF